ncbi:uncharacterized protein RMCB_6581 [Mycolicibacterium brisbanense]|uniref:Uncharacterized protein n=1 Tax=Mycolicibacterium brisbanense TaxID=146020 RepID=A0A100W6H2_9MYCO|nr:uncharacterized protein RMCB_6581 [Mycolicibacterium brisbanense]
MGRCTAIMARFINATVVHARSVPRTHRSRAQNRHPTSIAAVRTAATLVSEIRETPCSAAEHAASTAQSLRPKRLT